MTRKYKDPMIFISLLIAVITIMSYLGYFNSADVRLVRNINTKHVCPSTIGRYIGSFSINMENVGNAGTDVNVSVDGSANIFLKHSDMFYLPNGRNVESDFELNRSLLASDDILIDNLTIVIGYIYKPGLLWPEKKQTYNCIYGKERSQLILHEGP